MNVHHLSRPLRRRKSRELTAFINKRRWHYVVDQKTGKRYFGHPVDDHEWRYLPDWSKVVLYRSVGTDGQPVGEPLEWFRVQTDAEGKPCKQDLVNLRVEEASSEELENVPECREAKITHLSQERTVVIFATKELLREWSPKVRPNVFVSVEAETKKRLGEVYEVTASGARVTVGKFRFKELAPLV